MDILNLGIIKALPVPLPPLAEQLYIVAEVARHVSFVREVEAQVDANLKAIERLRQSILAKSFFRGLYIMIETIALTLAVKQHSLLKRKKDKGDFYDY